MKSWLRWAMLCLAARPLVVVSVLMSLAAPPPGYAQTPQIKVPRVIGTGLREAEEILQRAGLRVGPIQMVSTDIVPPLYVVEQSPQAGVIVARNTQVSLVVRDFTELPLLEQERKLDGSGGPRLILANVYDYLSRKGQEGPGYGLYSYVLFPFYSVRAAHFLEQLFTTTGYRRHSVIDARHLNVFQLPTQADKVQAIINRTLLPSRPSAHPSGQEFATELYDYALAQKLLAQICLKPAKVIRDLCATALTAGPYLLTYGQPMSTLSPVPPPYLVLDLSRVHVQAFREFIIAYQEQVKRPDYTDRERLDTLRLRVLSIILTAADWIAPPTSAIADIIHIAP